MLLEVGEDLLLELELLRNRLDHHVDPGEGAGEVRLEAQLSAPAVLVAETVEDRARQLHAGTRLLELLCTHVVERDFHARALEDRAHPRSHGAGSDHGSLFNSAH
jgi:hypothetical protein